MKIKLVGKLDDGLGQLDAITSGIKIVLLVLVRF